MNPMYNILAVEPAIFENSNQGQRDPSKPIKQGWPLRFAKTKKIKGDK